MEQRGQVVETVARMECEEEVYIHTYSFSQSELTKVFSSLGKSQTLKTLTVANCKLMKRLAHALHTNTSLRELKLAGKDCPCATAVPNLGQHVAHGLLAHCTMTKLTLTSLRFASCSDFSKFTKLLLPGNSLLKSLTMKHCNLQDQHIIASLVGALKSNRLLVELNLCGNRIGNAGAMELAACLAKGNCTLQCLDLAGNCIGTEGFQAFATLLSSQLKNGLIALSLDSQARTMQSWALSGDALGQMLGGLQRLSLSQCNLSSADAHSIATSLAHNNSLVELNLSNNPHMGCDDDLAATRFALAIKTNTMLKSLRLDHCGFTPAGVKQLTLAVFHSNIDHFPMEDPEFRFINSLAVCKFMLHVKMARRVWALRSAAEAPRLASRAVIKRLPSELTPLLVQMLCEYHSERYLR